MISRRAALGYAGGAALFAGVGRAFDQRLIVPLGTPGLTAWDDWNQDRYVGPLSLVAAGVLAASPHNSQPWRFAIGRLGVDIFEVPGRGLGAMDPFGRERILGLGAAIHNMALASTGIDRSAVVRLLPDPANPAHVARIELGREGQRLPRIRCSKPSAVATLTADPTRAARSHRRRWRLSLLPAVRTLSASRCLMPALRQASVSPR